MYCEVKPFDCGVGKSHNWRRFVLGIAAYLVVAVILFFVSLRPAFAAELVDGETPITTSFDNYVICRLPSDSFYYVFLNVTDGGYKCYGLRLTFDTLDKAADFLKTKDLEYVHAHYGNGTYEIDCRTAVEFYSNVDIHYGEQVFPKTPYLIHTASAVGGLQAQEIAARTMKQVLGLVPLVIGLIVSAIGLRKALAMLFRRLRRA